MEGSLSMNTEVQQIPLCRLNTELGTQIRVTEQPDVVADFVTCMDRGDRFPPLVAFDVPGKDMLVLTDGFKRHEAYGRRGAAVVDVEVHTGTLDDARWYAIGANQTHGARRTNADKANAVKQALLHPNGCSRSWAAFDRR